ncbi:MAG: hypothetical protein MHMPM18_004806, partial [Marteilia pararefringens]
MFKASARLFQAFSKFTMKQNATIMKNIATIELNLVIRFVHLMSEQTIDFSILFSMFKRMLDIDASQIFLDYCQERVSDSERLDYFNSLRFVFTSLADLIGVMVQYKHLNINWKDFQFCIDFITTIESQLKSNSLEEFFDDDSSCGFFSSMCNFISNFSRKKSLTRSDEDFVASFLETFFIPAIQTAVGMKNNDFVHIIDYHLTQSGCVEWGGESEQKKFYAIYKLSSLSFKNRYIPDRLLNLCYIKIKDYKFGSQKNSMIDISSYFVSLLTMAFRILLIDTKFINRQLIYEYIIDNLDKFMQNYSSNLHKHMHLILLKIIDTTVGQNHEFDIQEEKICSYVLFWLRNIGEEFSQTEIVDDLDYNLLYVSLHLLRNNYEAANNKIFIRHQFQNNTEILFNFLAIPWMQRAESIIFDISLSASQNYFDAVRFHYILNIKWLILAVLADQDVNLIPGLFFKICEIACSSLKTILMNSLKIALDIKKIGLEDQYKLAYFSSNILHSLKRLLHDFINFISRYFNKEFLDHSVLRVEQNCKNERLGDILENQHILAIQCLDICSLIFKLELDDTMKYLWQIISIICSRCSHPLITESIDCFFAKKSESTDQISI